MEHEAWTEQTCPVLIESEVGQGVSTMCTLVDCQGWKTTGECWLTSGYEIVLVLSQSKPEWDIFRHDIGHLRANAWGFMSDVWDRERDEHLEYVCDPWMWQKTTLPVQEALRYPEWRKGHRRLCSWTSSDRIPATELHRRGSEIDDLVGETL